MMVQFFLIVTGLRWASDSQWMQGTSLGPLECVPFLSPLVLSPETRAWHHTLGKCSPTDLDLQPSLFTFDFDTESH